MTQPRWILLLATTLVGAALAGCTTPDESQDDQTTPTVNPDGTPPGAMQWVRIDGHLYECEDTITDDQICNDYENIDPADAPAESQPGADVQTDADGRATIDGHVYECSTTSTVLDDVGDDEPCSSYERVEE